MDPKDFVPDFSKLTPEQRSAAAKHLVGLARIYAELTDTKIDDFVVQIFERAVGPNVIGDVQAFVAGAEIPAGVDPATLLMIFQLVGKLLELWSKK